MTFVQLLKQQVGKKAFSARRSSWPPDRVSRHHIEQHGNDHVWQHNLSEIIPDYEDIQADDWEIVE